MRIKNGDKFITKKPWYLSKGEAVYVTSVNDGYVEFSFGEDPTINGYGQMDINSFNEHFEKAKKTAPSVNPEWIKEIMDNSQVVIKTMFNKCTVVSCQLPNGFVITEYSACVSPENYNELMGVEICLKKIESKIWELEGYRLQEVLYQETLAECNCKNCEEYDCPDKPYR